jgi:F0F1-type ATP synthase membrane subunit c/vacuolar-type H+-ATPase subunit K
MSSERLPYLKHLIFIAFSTLLFLVFSTNKVFAQLDDFIREGAATLGVARMVEIKEKNVKDGAIISTAGGKVALSSIPYDGHVVGVVSRDAAIILSTKTTSSSVPVISNGTVYLLVSSKEGNIKKGDILTTSTIPGVAAKAVKDGYVLGTALEDYENQDTKKVEKIAADLDLHYFNSKPTFPGTLSDILKIALLPTREGPTPLFKYIVAAAVVLGSFVLAFLTFGRTAAKGVEALGRNPSASRVIHLGIIFNVSIVVVIVLSGLVVAFLILRL